jgi:formylglycine-generating enzyme required for sulfatase activity
MRSGLILYLMLLTTSLTAMTVATAEDDPAKLLETFRSEFVLITPGEGKFPKSYRRGSEAVPNERPVKEVTIPKPFMMAKYEVPQNLFELVMGHNPSRWKGPRNSAEMMTFAEAEDFCRRITSDLQKAKLIGATQVIRLPTEAEWEYCCRAGTDTAYSFGDEARGPGDEGTKATLLDPYAWHTGNAAGNDPAVGALKPNPWGLYDMHGYLWEYCIDPWKADYSAAPVDDRTIRGGSWKDRFSDLRSASRKRIAADQRDDAVGFRCVLTVDPDVIQ